MEFGVRPLTLGESSMSGRTIFVHIFLPMAGTYFITPRMKIIGIFTGWMQRLQKNSGRGDRIPEYLREYQRETLYMKNYIFKSSNKISSSQGFGFFLKRSVTFLKP